MGTIIKAVTIVIVALVVLAVLAPFFDARTPAAYVAAKNDEIRMQPTATAAALMNDFSATRVAVVAKAQAKAEAESITANNEQRIQEDAHQQALRHTGEMAALNISNTLRLNEINADYTTRVESITAMGAKDVAEANADAQRASAGAWRDTITYGGIAVGAIVLLVGVAVGIVLWLSLRAKIIDHPLTGPILITEWGVIPLGNITTPMLLRNGTEIGSNVFPLVGQRQAFGLIRAAMKSQQPDMVHAAEKAATSAMQQSWTPSTMLDSAVAALPSGRDESVFRVPSFRELLQTWRPSRKQMLLGVDRNGTQVFCALEDLLSTGIIGRPKMGKSTLLRFIYLQCRLIGANVYVWDLHLTVAGDLPGANVHTDLQDINQSAERICALLDKRIKGREYEAQPVMIMADEFNLLAPNSNTATEAIGRIILEGRKVQMFSMISGQGLPANLFGGSTARDALSSRFIMHTTTRQASMAGLDRDYLPLVVDLKPGTAIVDGPIDPQILSIPNTTESDLRAFFPPSGSPSNAPSTSFPDDFQMTSAEGENTGEINDFASVEGGKCDLVRSLFLDGKSQSEIIYELWGVRSGRAYQVAAEEMRQIIQGLMK